MFQGSWNIRQEGKGFLFNTHMTTYKLDITKEHCPMTFVKTKLELAKIQQGDLLEVLLKEGEPLDSVPKSSQEQGYEIVEISHVEKDIYKVIIKK